MSELSIRMAEVSCSSGFSREGTAKPSNSRLKPLLPIFSGRERCIHHPLNWVNWPVASIMSV